MIKDLYVLYGPSGSGKSALAKECILPEIISVTTRKPRPGEEDGINYYFMSEQEFDRLSLVESTIYDGNKYGITMFEFNRENYSKAVVVTNYAGIKQLKKNCPEYGVKVYAIFVYSDKETLIRRMRDRGDSEDNINKRLSLLDAEYSNMDYADHVIFNVQGDLKTCYDRLDAFILGT